MRHRQRNRKLGRTSSHRSALFRNQLASIIREERIVTTLPKAKELRPIIEKIVTLGRDDSVHHRRQAARSVADKELLKKLFEEIGPRFTDRPGGYTRIVKLGPRRGDGAEMALLEFVDFELATSDDSSPAPTRKKKAKSDDSDEGEEETADEAAEKPAPKKAAKKKSGGAKKSKSGAKKTATKKSSGAKKSSSKKSGGSKSSSKKSSSKKSSKKKS